MKNFYTKSNVNKNFYSCCHYYHHKLLLEIVVKK